MSQVQAICDDLITAKDSPYADWPECPLASQYKKPTAPTRRQRYVNLGSFRLPEIRVIPRIRPNKAVLGRDSTSNGGGLTDVDRMRGRRWPCRMVVWRRTTTSSISRKFQLRASPAADGLTGRTEPQCNDGEVTDCSWADGGFRGH
jgi:hypothetical protein